VYFSANDGVGGAELWRSDGTPEGTTRVKEIRPGSTGSDPRFFVEYNGMVLFSADDGAAGRELWRSNGTPEGTVRVADIQTGSFGGNPSSLVRFDNAVFFAADPGGFGASTRGDLYRTCRSSPSQPSATPLTSPPTASTEP
jgi:ELWxxDGT repeat protein